MSREQIPLAQGFYVSESLDISNQQCVNWRPNVPQTSTITTDNLFRTEGIVQLDSVGLFKSRGAHVMNEIQYFVIAGSLIRLNEILDSFGNQTFSSTDLGSIAGSERVYMADNGTQLVIVAVPDDDTIGVSYVYTASTETLVEITDVNFDGPASSVVYVSSYFSFHKSDGKKFFNSPLDNAIGPYDPLDFQTASADPDQIRAQVVWRNQLYILGSQTIQPFRATSRVPSPFLPIQGGVIDVGVAAPHTVKIFAGGISFVGQGENESPAVWQVVGASKNKISTIAIDNELSKLTPSELVNVYSWVYGESGSFQYGISLPNTTFVYDVVNARWHERKSIIDGELTSFRVATMTFAYGQIIVSDNFDGRIGKLDKNEYLEYGTIIRQRVTTRPFDNDGNPIRITNIEAVVQAGVGLSSDITVKTGETVNGVELTGTGGADPKITLSWSDDGGYVFKGFLSRSMGKIGERKRRPIWRQGIGRVPRSVVFALECAAPTNNVLIKLEADVG